MQFLYPADAVEYIKKNVSVAGKVVFLDIDDTLLTLKERALCVITYMLRFYEYLVAENARIYIITARPYSEYNLEQTTLQLQAFGFKQFEALFLMKLTPGVPATAYQIAIFKSTIRKAVRESLGLECALSVGNEWHDLLLPSFVGVQLNPMSTFLFSTTEEPIDYLLKLPVKSL